MSVGTKTSSVSGRKGLEMMTEKETLAMLARRAFNRYVFFSSKANQIIPTGTFTSKLSGADVRRYGWYRLQSGIDYGEAYGYVRALEILKSNTSQKSAQ